MNRCHRVSLLLLVIFGATSCDRRTDAPPIVVKPPTVASVGDRNDGIEIAPPVGEHVGSPVKSSPDLADQTLVLLAKLCEDQKAMVVQLKNIGEQNGTLLPAINTNTQQLKQIQETELPIISENITKLKDSTEKLETRVKVLEEALKNPPPLIPPPPKHTVTPPTPPPPHEDPKATSSRGSQPRGENTPPTTPEEPQATSSRGSQPRGENTPSTTPEEPQAPAVPSPGIAEHAEPAKPEAPHFHRENTASREAHRNGSGNSSIEQTGGRDARGTNEDVVAPAPVQSKYSPHQQELRKRVRTAYQKLVDDFPEHPESIEAYFALAGMEEEEGNWQAAISLYEKLLGRFSKSPKALDARLKLGNALAEKGKFQEAISQYFMIADGYPRDKKAGVAQLAIADCLARSGQETNAIREYRHIETAHDGDEVALKARQKRAELLVKVKKYTDAIDLYKLIIKSKGIQGPRGSEMELKLALAQRADGQKENARETLLNLLPRTANDELGWKVRWNLAEVLYDDEKFLDAARAFAKLGDDFSKDPNVADARLHSSEIFFFIDLNNDAAKQAALALKSLRTAPLNLRKKYEPRALYTSALALRKSEDPKEVEAAGACLDELRSNYPDDPFSLKAEIEDAKSKAAAGRVADAISLMQQVVRKYPASTEAMEELLKLVERTPTNASYGVDVYSEILNHPKVTEGNTKDLIKLGRALKLQQLRRDDEASQIYKEMIDNPKVEKGPAALARYQQSVLDEQAGRIDEAITGYTEFIQEMESVGSETTKAPTTILGIDLSTLISDAKWKLPKLQVLVPPKNKAKI